MWRERSHKYLQDGVIFAGEGAPIHRIVQAFPQVALSGADLWPAPIIGDLHLAAESLHPPESAGKEV